MDLTGRRWHKNTGKNAVFRRLVEVCGRRWTMKWWPGAELNRRHADFQSAALPTELPGRAKPLIYQRSSAGDPQSGRVLDRASPEAVKDAACLPPVQRSR